MNQILIGGKRIHEESPTYIVAEIGINHNGDIDVAKKLIDVAANAGADAVKFQKRTPELCVPEDQKYILRETPWGIITYIEYREKMEFNLDQYKELSTYSKKLGLHLFASPWDIESLNFLLELGHDTIKIASACMTDNELLQKLSLGGTNQIVSTGMSTMDQIRKAVALCNRERLLLCHSTSSYPCKPEELNLRMINTLKTEFNVLVGYSGHEVGLSTTIAAVALGAKLIERHITLDRSMWGSDQSASIEPLGFAKLIRDIRNLEKALGNGIKTVYESEYSSMKKLRKHN